MSKIQITPPAEQIVEVTNVDHMAIMMVEWQQKMLSLLNHIRDMPAGTEVTYEDDAVMTLVGDALAGFQLGLSIAIEELSVLPFESIPPESSDKDAEMLDTPASLVTVSAEA